MDATGRGLVRGAVALRQVGTVFSIQLLRFVAATLVVLFHTQQSFALRARAPVSPTETYLFGFGAVGVHIFFVISGFIMVLTSIRPDKPYEAGKFFKRRLLRIYPIYWICVLLYIAVFLLTDQPFDLTLRQTVGALLLWPGDAGRFIGPGWTLSFEIYFYLCFGLAMMLSLTRGLIVLFLVFGGAIALGYFVRPTTFEGGLATSALLAEFLAGAAVGWLAQMGYLPRKGGAALTALGLGLFVAGIFADYSRWPSPVVWGIPSAVLILGLVSWENARGAAPVVQRLSRLGDSSYVLYLIHIAVITMAEHLCHRLPDAAVPSPPVAALIVALVSLALAEAIHRGIERPMLALLNPNRSLVPLRAKEAHPS